MNSAALLGLVRHWRWIIATALVAGILSASVSMFIPARYTAKAEALLSLSGTADVGQLAQGDTFLQASLRSYAALAKTPIVLTPVIERLKLMSTPDRLATQITTNVQTDTVLLSIEATDNKSKRAAEIANAVVNSLSNLVGTIEPKQSNGDKSVVLSSIRTAIPPLQPDQPRPLYLTILGILLGAGVAATLAGASTRVTGRPSSALELEQSLGAPLLATFRDSRSLDGLELRAVEPVARAIRGAWEQGHQTVGLATVGDDRILQYLHQRLCESPALSWTQAHDASHELAETGPKTVSRGTDRSTHAHFNDQESEQSHTVFVAGSLPSSNSTFDAADEADALVLVLDPRQVRVQHLQRVGESLKRNGLVVLGLVVAPVPRVQAHFFPPQDAFSPLPRHPRR